ncbi:MAG: hypothetical protein AAF202_05490, partial [Pseudomonadota bacterium]
YCRLPTALLCITHMAFAASGKSDLSKNKDFTLAMNYVTDHYYDEGFESAEILYNHWVKNLRSCTVVKAEDVVSHLTYKWGFEFILEKNNREDLAESLDQLLQESAKEYFMCSEVEFVNGHYSEGAYNTSSVISVGNDHIRFALKTLYVD